MNHDDDDDESVLEWERRCCEAASIVGVLLSVSSLESKYGSLSIRSDTDITEAGAARGTRRVSHLWACAKRMILVFWNGGIARGSKTAMDLHFHAGRGGSESLLWGCSKSSCAAASTSSSRLEGSSLAAVDVDRRESSTCAKTCRHVGHSKSPSAKR